jgi:hypothetical protein
MRNASTRSGRMATPGGAGYHRRRTAPGAQRETEADCVGRGVAHAQGGRRGARRFDSDSQRRQRQRRRGCSNSTFDNCARIVGDGNSAAVWLASRSSYLERALASLLALQLEPSR